MGSKKRIGTAIGSLFTRRALAGVVVFVGMVAPQHLSGQDGELQVREVTRYGVDGQGNPTLELGAITSVVVLPDSTIWVLDPLWPKLVKFSPQGDVIREAVLSKGEGPGEVRTPTDLARGGDGLVIVDQGAGKLLFYSSEGEFVEEVRLNGGVAWRVAVAGDQLWATAAGLPNDDPEATTVLVFDGDGDLVETRRTRHPVDLAFGRGLAIAVHPSDQSAVITATKGPGSFWVHRPDGSERIGSDLIEDDGPWRGEFGQLVVPTQVPSIAVASDGNVLQVWTRSGEDGRKFGLDEMVQGMTWLDQGGRVILHGRLPDEVLRSPKYAHVSGVTRHLYVPSNETFPMLVEYELMR